MRISIETYGCAMNKADSEIIAGLLEEKGFLNSCPDDADILIVNTCIVKTPTERKILKRLNELKNSKKKVIVSGCLPAAMPWIIDDFPTFSFIGINVFDVVDAVEETINDGRLVKIRTNEKEKVCAPKVRINPVVEIIPIAEGCLGNCSYCQIKMARGKLRSYPIDSILKQVKRALTHGIREIWITTQDTCAYGMDSGTNLAELLGKITRVDGDFRIRVGMMNPKHAINLLDELIGVYKDEKIYKFLHIPVQSGDDQVLRDMNRGYGVDDFKTVVRKFREEFDVTLATDVIVGFPTEDIRAFNRTVDLINEIKPDIVNISRFWARPGTKASKLKPLHGRTTKERSRKMNEVFRKIGMDRNKKWIGWTGKVLISDTKRDFCGRNLAYKPIILKSGGDLLGEFVDVEITDATYYDLRGRIN